MSKPREKVIELYSNIKNASGTTLERDGAITNLKAFLCEMNKQIFTIQENKFYWQSVDIEFNYIVREMPDLLP